MTTTKHLLNRINSIIENSEGDTLTEIKNISDILEVNGKVATVLHFVNKDSDWNPHTLTILDDLLKEEKLTEGMSQEKMDFYLLNYLDKNWREPLEKKVSQMSDYNFMSVWLTGMLADIIADLRKLGLYPEIDFKANPEKGFVEYEDFVNILGDENTFVYKPVADWIEGITSKTKNEDSKYLNEQQLLKEAQTLEILKTYVDGDVSDEFLLTKIKPQVEEKVKEICAPCFEDGEMEIDEQKTNTFRKDWWDESHIRGIDELFGKGTYTREAIIRFLNTEEGFKFYNSSYNPTPTSIDMLHPLDKKAGKTQSCMRCHQFFSPGGRLPDQDELIWLYQQGWQGPSWKTIEYISAAISVGAMFFGPAGWVVSGLFGLVGAYSLYKQGNPGAAKAALVFELIPVVSLINRWRKISKFAKVGEESITKSLKYFENPTKTNYNKLNKVEKEIVDYTTKNKDMATSLLKYTDEALDKNKIILNIKDKQAFLQYKKMDPKNFNMTWKEFQGLQKSIKESIPLTNKIKNGIKKSILWGGAITGGAYVFKWLENYFNREMLCDNLSETRDYITEAKLGDRYHYRCDRVLGGTYPYNKKMVGSEYDMYFKDDILLLNLLWYDKERFPELRNNKTSQGDELSATCVGVNVEGGIPNPGGGWRPNLDCLKDYSLAAADLKEMGDLMKELNTYFEKLSNGEMDRNQFNKQVTDSTNLPNVDKWDLEFTEEEVWD